MSKPKQIIVDIDELSSGFGVSTRQIERWQREGCPTLTKGVPSRKTKPTFDLFAVAIWLRERAASKSKKPESKKKTADKAPEGGWMEEIRRLKATMLQQQMDQRAGNLVHADEVRSLIRRWTAFWQSRVEVAKRALPKESMAFFSDTAEALAQLTWETPSGDDAGEDLD